MVVYSMYYQCINHNQSNCVYVMCYHGIFVNFIIFPLCGLQGLQHTVLILPMLLLLPTTCSIP